LAYIGEDEYPENRVPDWKTPSDDLLKEFAGLKLPVRQKTIKSPQGRDIFYIDIEEI